MEYFLIPLLLVGLYVVSIYNTLVTLKTRIKASIQEIGNQLKRQVDLIPNLEESTKGYLKHETQIIKLLADARKSIGEAVASGDMGKIGTASQKVADLLPQLRVVVESNPQIKGADVVTRLMDELRDTSDKVMYSRRTLIDLTADYNVKVATVPSSFVAKLFGFSEEKGLVTPDTGSHLEVSVSDTQTPKVKLS